jgi:hypothetical protein
VMMPWTAALVTPWADIETGTNALSAASATRYETFGKATRISNSGRDGRLEAV